MPLQQSQPEVGPADSRPAIVERVVGIVGRVLGRQECDPAESFLALGGTSLAAVHVVMLLQAECRSSLSLEEFFDAPDLQSVADLILRERQRPPP